MQLNSVLVTGSNRGIGLEFVRQFALMTPPPKHVFATCRDLRTAVALHDLKSNIKTSTELHILRLDVKRKMDIQKAAEYVEGVVGHEGLNLIINNAGIGQFIPFMDITEDDMINHFRVNTLGPFLVTQAFYPLLKKASNLEDGDKMSCSRAAIVNISSDLGSLDYATNKYMLPVTPYRVSKAGLNMVTRKTAEDLAQEHILVVSLHPGFVITDMTRNQGRLTTEESVQSMLKTMDSWNESHTGGYYKYDGSTLPW